MNNHIERSQANPNRRLKLLPLTSAMCVALGLCQFPSRDAKAQTAPSTSTKPAASSTQRKPQVKELQTVIVTAQKRTQNLQDVHAALQVLDKQQIHQLNIQSFQDYVQYMPSVSFQQGGGSIAAGSGFAWINMRGVASGGQRNYSGSSPSVAVYLDNEPITTIQGPIDPHTYDINRIEVLQGPQSTLFGASAEAGAIRIITNQPDPSGFSANYSLEGSKVQFGDLGFTAEGMANVPITRLPFVKDAALRVVAWYERDPGFIDNDPGERTFPSSGITVSNKPNCVPSDKNLPSSTLQCIGHAQDNYNGVTTKGGRAALKIDLNDNWTTTAMLMGQQTLESGTPASDTAVGMYSVLHYYPERVDDRWIQAALSVEGKIGNFDVDYTYSRLTRDQSEMNDYSDYAFWYDTLVGLGQTFKSNSGDLINPSYSPIDHDRYYDTTNELHISSPNDDRFMVVAGIFNERDKGDIVHNFFMNGLATSLSVTGFPGTLWYNNEARIDRSFGVYGQASFDLIPHVLTATAGGRYYRTSDRLYGFYGFGAGYAPAGPGEGACGTMAPFRDAPCLLYDRETKDSGPLKLYTISWHVTPSAMVYATRSEGFRPGGINRNPLLAPYKPDFLINYELGWKTSWFDHRLTFNGDIFRDKWDSFQFTILGPSGIGEIMNAAQAVIKGLESSVDWQATYNLHLGAGVAAYDAKLADNYCGFTDPAGTPVTDCPEGTIDPGTSEPVSGPQAPAGTRLPITPILKSNLIARYEFSLGANNAFWQVAWIHVGARNTDLRTAYEAALGTLPAYNLFNLSAGLSPDDDRWAVSVFLNNALNAHAALYKFTECDATICGAHGVVAQYPSGQVYTGYAVPRSIGIRFTERFGGG